jgi:hypothetical protein
MTIDGEVTLEQMLKEFEPFELKPEDKRCEHARNFSGWVRGWLIPEIVGEQPDPVSVNKAVLMLTHKYFSYEFRMPSRHWNQRGEPGHICVFQIFSRTYRRFEKLLYSGPPPMYYEEPPSLPPPEINLNGTTAGLWDDD